MVFDRSPVVNSLVRTFFIRGVFELVTHLQFFRHVLLIAAMMI
jgi:hypothetical protein